MKIIYVTTCINPKRFFQGNKENKKALNPSGQNFHFKMIKALKSKCDIEVISIPPLSPYLTNRLYIPRFEEEVEGIKFHYVHVSYSKIYKFVGLRNNIRKEIKKIIMPDDVIIYDGLNRPATFALVDAFPNHKKVMILTDDPANLTYGGKGYTKSLQRRYPKVENAIALTPHLFTLLPNIKNKLQIEGIMNENPFSFEPNEYSPYIFLGGALFSRYGVDTLLNAFLELEHPTLNLVLCGQGDLVEMLNKCAQRYHHVHFLGLISNEEILKLEAGALFNVNPRPIDASVDINSVPSKLIEYASSKRPIISTKNNIIESLFGNHISYFKGDDLESIKEGLKEMISLSEEKAINKGKEAYNAIKSRLDSEIVASKILDFLHQ